VVTKVPLDPCGNPIPAAAATPAVAAPALAAPATAATYEAVPAPTASPAPAAAARPEAPAAAATDAGPVKTFSDRPAEAATPTPAADGWKASNLEHTDPSIGTKAEVRRAEKPAAESARGELRKIEPIPAPATSVPSAATTPEKVPTIAPPGPVVEPAAPAHDPRDVPASETSGRGILRPIPADHTT
jgi:hypothetical protein